MIMAIKMMTITMVTITMVTIKMMTIATPGDGCAPRDASDWTALDYRSLEQPSSPRVQLWFMNATLEMGAI